MLFELPFHVELSIRKTNHPFRGYAMSFKVEKIEQKYPTNQLEASKLSIKNLLNDFLNETKGFKYQITLNVLLQNTNQIEKLSLDHFISMQKQNQ